MAILRQLLLYKWVHFQYTTAYCLPSSNHYCLLSCVALIGVIDVIMEEATAITHVYILYKYEIFWYIPNQKAT
jgi:hypothetical protein